MKFIYKRNLHTLSIWLLKVNFYHTTRRPPQFGDYIQQSQLLTKMLFFSIGLASSQAQACFRQEQAFHKIQICEELSIFLTIYKKKKVKRKERNVSVFTENTLTTNSNTIKMKKLQYRFTFEITHCNLSLYQITTKVWLYYNESPIRKQKNLEPNQVYNQENFFENSQMNEKESEHKAIKLLAASSAATK